MGWVKMLQFQDIWNQNMEPSSERSKVWNQMNNESDEMIEQNSKYGAVDPS